MRVTHGIPAAPGTDAWYEKMVDNLMIQVREWVAQRGGATGELRLVKSCGVDNQWVIEMSEIRPTSTWILGR